ncbi:MAG: sulfatase [Pirellulaceae bacterium]
MSIRIFYMLLAILLCCPMPLMAQRTTVRPNILLIFADDLGWKDVGYQGSDFYETPNIDRLAKQGMVFGAAYASAGNCQPSRACLISGQYTPRHHVYAVNSTERGPKPMMRTIPIPNRSGLGTEVVSIADALKDAGYRTGIFGKWHLSGPEGCEPGEQGFDVVMDVPQQGNGVREDPKGIYEITNAAIDFMKSDDNRPFFAYVSHHAVHTGWQFQKQTQEHFQTKSNQGLQHTRRGLASCIYDFDNAVGELMQALNDLNIAENTLVIFTSDNGGTNASSQEPLRGNKGGYYEGGIREPFFAIWPGKIKAGTKCDTPIINVDFFPTLLDVAGVLDSTALTLDGESILPLLQQSGKLKRKSIFWHFPGYLDMAVIRGRDPEFRTRPVSVINRDHWKLLLYHEEWNLDGGREKMDINNSVELYDLRNDMGEHNNVALTNKQVRDELVDELLDWMKQTNAQMARDENPDFDPEFQPQPKRDP